MKTSNRLAIVSVLSTLSFAAFAQTPPPPVTPVAPPPVTAPINAPATTGVTNVAAAGFAKSEAAAENKDVTDATVSAGGLFIAGNARSLALTAAIKGRLRRDIHQFSFAVAGNYARAAAAGLQPDGTKFPISATAQNVQGLLRYDVYVADDVSLFLQSSVRHDRFQALDLRLNVDPGVAYYFLHEKEHRFWGEIGADIQHDVRTKESVDAANIITPGSTDRTVTRISARAYFGYENKINKAVGFTGGLEWVHGLSPDAEWFRTTVDAGLKSQLSDKFSVAVTTLFRYESKPVSAAVEKIDVTTSLNLVYSMF
ncbi:MAG: DUF481 domain-containing protein [Polyangiaceae bacterium]|nr:DUF481 domain-containing protein [Polyangiaceae bacterium]